MRTVPLSACLMTLCCLVSGAPGLAAENTDPNDDGSQYAYAENLGWVNAEPGGDGGRGLEVRDFRLLGYLWSENAGWINLSCRNEGSCAAATYGVEQDGDGHLSGYAWAENVGWINFSPAEAGVSIDPATGDFSGRAWGENVGWITFASDGPHPYKVQVGWTCDPPPALPGGVSDLSVSEGDDVTRLDWSAVADATAYDVVEGDVRALLASGGDFSEATDNCETRKTESTSAESAFTPAADEAAWYLVRAANCGGEGTYDSESPSQDGVRDSEISDSTYDCE